MNTNTDTRGRAPALPQDVPPDTELLVVSFGFDRGPAPEGCAFVLDLRPVVPAYGLGPFKAMTGRDPQVSEHVRGQRYVPRLLGHLTDVALDLLVCADRDGGPVVVALGSADGTRRSVALADQLAKSVGASGGYCTHVAHLHLPTAQDPAGQEGI